MRILVTGDTHGEILWWDKHVLKLAQRRRAEVVVQVGDFGLWPGEERYLDRLQRLLDERNLRVVFIDGNHEDYGQLLALPLDAEGWRPVRPCIRHAPRGHRWTWAGLRFLAGGAFW